MNRIILAYCAANTDLAEHIDNQLSRIGIPFEHVTSATGNLASAIKAAGEPVLLLVTDNLLKDRSSMRGLFEALQQLPYNLVLLPVIADGVGEDGQPIPTHIDRMVHMLHYMNYWQSEWLNISSRFQSGQGVEKSALEPELDAVRTIANQAGDLITFLKERGAVDHSEFKAHDFALFFDRFGLNDWHGQYRRLVAQTAEQDQVVEPIHLPETPLSSGLLTPEPVEALLPIEEVILHKPSTPDGVQPVSEQIILSEITTPDTHEPKVVSDAQIELTIQDALFWIERGHQERGLELLKIASEEYPDNERIAAAYKNALPSPVSEVPLVAALVEQTPTQEADQEVRSYEMMGDKAAEKGDYLFAKYCWDRVVEVNPKYTGIYRKLGLMTAEHLHDYRETAIHYLEKALAAKSDDDAVKSALAGLMEEKSAASSFQPVELVPDSMVAPVEIVPVLEPEPIAARPVISASPGTVLITGATSGIGRATAEIFAQHGYRLILTGRRVDRLVALKNHLEASYQTESLLLPFDVRDAGAVSAALENLPASFQEIDILLNNAGLAKGLAPIQEGNLDHWETMIDTNVKGLLYVTRVIAPGMVARKRGHIINVGSSAGKEVYPNGNVYCATKFAVDALTRAIRLDLHAHNIRVSQVSPGHVEETEFAITRFDGDAERAKIYNDFQPLKSSDVAEVIYFMATRPAHVNVLDVQLFATQQANSTVINRSGR